MMIGVPSTTRGDVVTDWNQIGITAMVSAGRGQAPMYPDLAYEHIAIYDAVNAIDGRYTPFAVQPSSVPAGASDEAAAISAAYTVLITIYPTQAGYLNAQYAASLAAIPDGTPKTDGINLGHNVALAFLASRADDGRDAIVPFVFHSGPGAWVPPAPGITAPNFPWLPYMRPFAMQSPSQFRADPPPSLDSLQYAEDFNEVKSLGAINSSTRTPEQTEIANFYFDHGPKQTGRVVRNIAAENLLSTSDSARLFAMFYVALADASIAAWDSKSYYQRWRPITAIRNADIDGNPDTVADPTWTPLQPTPNHPDYVSAHGANWGAFTEALRQFFGTRQVHITETSDVTGTTHVFNNIDDLRRELINARVYIGYHTRTATVEGVVMGSKIGRYTAKNYFQPTN